MASGRSGWCTPAPFLALVGALAAAGCATPDLGGELTTQQMGSEVVRRLDD